MAKGVKAGDAYVRLSLDDKMKRSLNSASKRLKSFGRSIGFAGTALAAIGTGIITPILIASKNFADFGDNLDKVSARTGVAVESLSELGFAAEQSGATINDLEKGIRGMQRGMFDAKRGAGEMIYALAELGLEYKDLENLSPEKQFELIGDRLAGIQSDSIRAAVAMKAFGKAGTALLPMYGNIKQLREEAKALGITMTTKDAKAAAELTDSMNRLNRVFLAIKVAIGSAVGPLLSELSTKFAYILGEVIKFIKANKEFIVYMLKIGTIITVVGGALIGLGLSFAGLGFALSGIASAIGVATALLTGIGAAISAILSPIGLAVAAVGALVYAFFEFTETGKKTIEWFKSQFSGLLKYITDTIGFISKAFKAGGLDLAVKAAWVSIKVEFYNGMVYINGIWLDIYENAMHAWNQISTGVQQALQSIMQFGLKAANFISKSFWNANQSIIDAFVYVGKNVAKTLLMSGAISGNAYGDMVEDLRILKNAAKDFTDERKAGSDAFYDGIIEESKQKQKELEEAYRKNAVDIRKEFADGGKELKEELEKAKAEYDAIAEQINAIPEKTKQAAEQLSSGIKASSASAASIKTSSAGSFSAQAGRMLSVTTIQSRTAKATEETAENTRKMLNNNIAFG